MPSEQDLSPATLVADHPLRLALTEEMHARRFPPLKPPTEICQILILFDESDLKRAREHFTQLHERLNGFPLGNARHFRAPCAGGILYWEIHTEFVTLTHIMEFDGHDIFGIDRQGPILTECIDGVGGSIYRATRIALIDQSAVVTPDQLLGLFNQEDLVCCDVGDGAARVWADFRLHDDGFGRLLVQDRGLTGSAAARVVQQLQELGNYRKMALLGLAEAQVLTPSLRDIEATLTGLISEMAQGGERSDADLLNDLSGLASELARLTSQSRFRISATEAYAQIVADRLAGLAEGRVAGYPTLTEFTELRLTPAVRTCLSVSRRLEQVAEHSYQATSLLRTRIETVVEQQSRDLLQSMDRRTDLQLRLQHTVEGLSVVAITYYVVGLLHYLLDPFATFVRPLSVNAVVAIAVPVVGAFSWIALKTVRKSHARL